jgi:hypothetical protein
MLYPVIIGLLKMFTQGEVYTGINGLYFDCGTLVDLTSFGLADLPYRTVYFFFQNLETAIKLFGLKFLYKVRIRQTYGYLLAIHFRRFFALFSLKARRMKKNTPGTDFFPIPGNSQVFPESQFIQYMSIKFFLQQSVDIFNIVSMLVILGLAHGVQLDVGYWNYGATYAEELSIELFLEICFMVATVKLIQMKFPEFHPMQVRVT